jgi:acyl-CoA synthetase (NDP forming)
MEARPEVVRSYEDAGFLVYDDSERAVAALDGLARLREGFERQLPAPATARTVRRRLPDGPLTEAAAQELLGFAGVPFPESEVVTSPAEAAEAAARIGFPVVMKIVSADLPHKTEVGGVVLGVADAAAAAAEFTALTARVTAARPDAEVTGVLVARTAPQGPEVIVGTRCDPVFGPVILVGTGGVQAELFRDVATRVGAVDRKEALRMIAETRGHALLTGFRGLPEADVDALADLLVTVSAFAVAHADRIETVELNPVVVGEDGQGVLALDALVVPHARAAS